MNEPLISLNLNIHNSSLLYMRIAYEMLYFTNALLLFYHTVWTCHFSILVLFWFHFSMSNVWIIIYLVQTRNTQLSCDNLWHPSMFLFKTLGANELICQTYEMLDARNTALSNVFCLNAKDRTKRHLEFEYPARKMEKNWVMVKSRAE